MGHQITDVRAAEILGSRGQAIVGVRPQVGRSIVGYETGVHGVALDLDLASSQFRDAGCCYHVNGSHFNAVGLVEYLASVVDRYRIWSIEDGIGEDNPKDSELLAEAIKAIEAIEAIEAEQSDPPYGLGHL